MLSEVTGEIRSPYTDGNGRYDRNTLCRWTFDDSIDGDVQLQFTHIDLPDHQPFTRDGDVCERCCYDYVEVSTDNYIIINKMKLQINMHIIK